MTSPGLEQKPGSVGLLDQPIMAMPGVELMVERDGGLFECMIPLSLVDHMDVPVDHGKLVGLEEDFRRIMEHRGGTGQKTPARMGYVEGESFFRIIDGFHRYTALRNLGIENIYTTVEMVTLDELLDERIRNANMHENVRFARIAEWMGESWSLSELADRVPITSVFTIAHFGSEKLTGGKFSLTPEEFKACVTWAHDKADAWGTTVMSLYTTLQHATTVAPELIHHARPSRATRGPDEIPITPATVSILSARLGGKFEHQRLVTRTATARLLSGSQISRLAKDISDMTIKEARAHVAGINWAARKSKKPTVYKYPEDQVFRPGLIRGSSAVEPLAEITLVTLAAMRDADLTDVPKGRLEKIRADLELVSQRVAGMIAILGAQSAEVEPGTPARQIEYKTMEDFVAALGSSLDDGDFPPIENDEQYKVVRDLLQEDDVVGSLAPGILRKLKRYLANYAASRD